MAAGSLTKDLVLGTLTTSLVPYHTITDGYVGLLIHIKVTNTDASVARTTACKLVSPDSPPVSVYAWDENATNNPLQAGETRDYFLRCIPEGYAIELVASSGTVDVVMAIVEEEQAS